MKSTRYYSYNQEQSVAKLLNGKVVSNSGATVRAKGDVITSTLLVECKTCLEPKQSFSIKKQWLEDICKEAIREGKQHSILAFNFGPNESNYFIIDERFMKKIQTMLEE